MVGHSGGEDQLTGSADNFALKCGPAVSFRRRRKVPPATTKAIFRARRRRNEETNPNPSQGTMGYIAVICLRSEPLAPS
jgi:hypothetical protein